MGNTGQVHCRPNALVTNCSLTPCWRTSQWPSRPPPATFCASSAWRNWAEVIQPCSSITSPSGIRWRWFSWALPRASSSRSTAASIRAAVQADEQFHPPSKTGAVRLLQRCSHPEPQMGLAQVSKMRRRELSGMPGRVGREPASSARGRREEIEARLRGSSSSQA